MKASEVRSRVWRIEDDELRSAVERGIDLLTYKCGEFWPDNINTDTLEMEFPNSCVVGQVFECQDWRDYCNALSRMGLPKSSDYAFDIPTFVYYPDVDHVTYAELNDAWKMVLIEDN